MYIAIDIGGTNIRITASDSLTTIKGIKLISFPISEIFENDIKKIISTIHNLSPSITAIGMGIVGSSNKEGTIIRAHNLPNWINTSPKIILENIFHCPIFMDNDTVVAALGEATYGNTVNRDFTYIAWGTGMGGATATVIHKHIAITKLDWHMDFEEWEKYCGGNEIKKHFGKPANELTENEWQKVMKNFTKQLEVFIAKNNSGRIVFGGGIAIKQVKRLMTIAKDFSNVKIMVSGLGEETGLYGGFALIKNNL